MLTCKGPAGCRPTRLSIPIGMPTRDGRTAGKQPHAAVPSRPMHTVGIEMNSTALPAVWMSAPKTKISVGMSSSPPATPRKVLACQCTGRGEHRRKFASRVRQAPARAGPQGRAARRSAADQWPSAALQWRVQAGDRRRATAAGRRTMRRDAANAERDHGRSECADADKRAGMPAHDQRRDQGDEAEDLIHRHRRARGEADQTNEYRQAKFTAAQTRSSRRCRRSAGRSRGQLSSCANPRERAQRQGNGEVRSCAARALWHNAL